MQDTATKYRNLKGDESLQSLLHTKHKTHSFRIIYVDYSLPIHHWVYTIEQNINS